MSLSITQNTPWELCKASAIYFGDLTGKLYNHFNPNESVCWLVPTKDNDGPSYPCGKLGFMLNPINDKQLVAGLYVEKGLSKLYCKLSGNKKQAITHAMTDDWQWHKVMSDMSHGVLGKALDSITTEVGEKPLIVISGHYEILSKSENSEVKKLSDETIVYQYTGDGIIQIGYKPSCDKNPLTGLKNLSTLSELCFNLNKLPEGDFIWVDLVMGIPLQTSAVERSEIVSTELIAKKCLYNLEPWIG